MILAKWIFPGMTSKCKELYFHGNANCERESELLLKPKQIVTLDTYFNAFFYNAYQEYTDVNDVCVRTVSTGRLRIALIALGKGGKRELATVEAFGDHVETIFPVVSLDELPTDGMLFVEFKAQTETIIHSGTYEADIKQRNAVRIAVVICTYHREEYIVRNLEQIRRNLWDIGETGVSDAADCFVIDNGGSLKIEQNEHIQVLTNKNYGGSGGFTRGIIEAYRCGDKYSHVLLMDDDISFEPEIMARTIRFLQVASISKKPLCIGGQMLLEGKPTVQYEAGGNFINSRVQSVGQGMDLARPEMLLKNTALQGQTYQAWWYCCFPISEVDRIGLPLPLFIKCDDIEYGLRMCPQLILMNGIGVWHKDFTEKISPHLEYYIKRNELVVSALHDKKNKLRTALAKMLRACGKAALIGDTRNIDFILRAYDDFLKGPAFFGQTDEEELNVRLLKQCKNASKARAKTILTCFPRIAAMSIRLILEYGEISDNYLNKMGVYTGMDFWCEHLEIKLIGG